MTKEELEKEIKKYIDKNCKQWETDGLTIDDIVRIAVLDFVEPREKQIAELSKHIVELQEDKGELTDKVKELEAQIEKMKSCVNCRYCINEKCPWQPKGCGMKHWELRR